MTPTDLWSVLERAAAEWPRQPALVLSDNESVSYGELLERASGLARALAAKPGERIGYLGKNGPEFLEAYFAVAGLGAVLVPLNTRLAANELADILADCEPEAVLVDPELEDRLPEGLARLQVGSWSPAAPIESVLRAPDDPAQLYYTSGTTGRSKGVVLTVRNVLDHASAATSELDLAEDDTWAHVAPMFHLADAWATFAITLVGGRHVFFPSFEAREVLDGFVRHGVTVTNLVPTMLVRMVEEAKSGFEGHALRLVLSGGAPIAPRTVREVLDVFGCEYAQTYGLTETSPYLTLGLLKPHHAELTEEQQLALRARTGRAFETVELEVVDDQGNPVPPDDRTVGEIRARGTTVSPGYWNRPDESSAAFRNGWFHTGDLATIDGEGYLNIVDRKKDMILTGGECVFSIEVENVLHEHPAVLEAAVFGVPSAEWGEEVRAAVTLCGEVSDDELIALCKQRLANYKSPRVVVRMDALPRTGSGKISKAQLRETQLGAHEG